MTWSAKPLTVLHNSDNKTEMARLLAEHPGEGGTVVRNERLLGQLIPLRAFGDVRFKWTMDGKETPYSRLSMVRHRFVAESVRRPSLSPSLPLPSHVDPDIVSYLNPYVGYNVVPHFYDSPPYLHALPEVAYHRLTPRDRFLVIASDGLWDMMTPEQVGLVASQSNSSRM